MVGEIEQTTKKRLNYKYARNFQIDLYYIFLKGPRH